MGKYDFDTVVDRRCSDCVKYNDLQNVYGRTDVIPLWIADMDFAVSPKIVEALKERISHPVFGYSMPSDSFWQAIIDWQRERKGMEIAREELAFVPGIVKGLVFAVEALTNLGDKVVIQPPVYHPFKRVVENNGRIAVVNPLVELPDGQYDMDIEGLRSLVEREHPKMMILCNPHNPVGIVWSKATLNAVAEICAANGVIVVSDEIHSDLLCRGFRHEPFATVSEVAAQISVTFGAPSKTFNIPGFSSSWVAVKNKVLREKLFGWILSKELHETNIMAVVAAEAAYRYGGDWLEEALEYIDGNIDYVVKYVEQNIPGVKAVRPQASFLIWLDCRGLNLSHDELVDMFVNRARLALNDGAMFGAQGEGFMRMNVASPRSVLQEAMNRLREAVANLGK